MKINLLPGRVHDKSKLSTVWIVFVLLILAELAGLGFYQKSLRDRETQLTEEVAQAQQESAAVDKLTQEADAERAKIRGIDSKVQFVDEVMKYNEQRPDLYAHTIE